MLKTEGYKNMSCTRKIKKTIYASVAAMSFMASLFSGSMLEEKNGEFLPDNEFYRQPYSSLVFDYAEPLSGASRFSDMTQNDWFYNYVDTLVKDGVINGKSQNIYHPSGTLTLPECSALIVRCLGLEELAGQESDKLAIKSLSGSEKWYIGYIKVCIDAGIVPEGNYGFGYDKKGDFVMTTDYFENVPVKRCELAQYIYRMTILDGTGVVAKNTYSERGGLGHEFIRSGFYDLEAVSLYKDLISDFEDIPEMYRNAVLSCYYNGIFNGDDKGNFNPQNSITRAEIAKVISVLTDVSQRFGEDLRKGAFEISENDLRKDIYGNKELTKDTGYRILLESAKKATFDGKNVKIPLVANAPMGYIPEVHIYRKDANTTVKIKEITGNTQDSFVSGSSVTVVPKAGTRTVITYILRNIKEGGEVAGVLEMEFAGGEFVYLDGISEFSGEAKEIPVKN